MHGEVATLRPQVRRTPRKASKTTKITKAAKKISAAKIYVGSVMIVMLALSLKHVAGGVIVLTHADLWEGVAFAIGTDAALVSTEYAYLTATPEVRREIGKWCHALMGASLGLSAWLNSLGFAEGHIDLEHLNQISLGCFVPVAVGIMSLILTKLK